MEYRRSSRAPDTPAKMALRSTRLPTKLSNCGTKFSTPVIPARPKACCPAVWPHVTRCDSKRAMALYGHEIDETTTLLEANLGWICKLNKGDFVGREALAKQKEEGVKRRLVGFEITERGIARDEQDVIVDGAKVGRVTSGSPAPFLKKNIGMAYVPAEFAGEGQQIHIDVRGRLVAAQIVKTPFYKRELT